GDGIWSAGEQCEDGNLDNDDGCSSECIVENDLNLDDPTQGGFAEGGRDWYFLPLQEAGRIAIETTTGDGVCDTIDTVLDLWALTPDGPERVAGNDDGGIDRCSLVERFIEAGEYVVVVSEAGNNAAIQAYTITAGFARQAAEGEGCDPAGELSFCAPDLYCVGEEGAETCQPAACGDGIVNQDDEECDDGNDVDDDLCGNDCLINEGCGNTQVDPGEECDDTNGVNCDDACLVDVDVTAGGDFATNVPEGSAAYFRIETEVLARYSLQTNDGMGEGACPGGDTTLTLFQVTPEGVEQIAFNDDEPDAPGFCSLINAELEPGAYVVRLGDLGNNDAIEAINLTVTVEQSVGIGAACDPAGEEAFCDVGLVCPEGDAPVCAEPVCGDGIISNDEECDDGNDVDGDGCNSCAIVAIAIGDACDPDSDVFLCDPAAYCGEGDVCVAHVCGDGVIGNGELCDGEPGCSDQCTIENDITAGGTFAADIPLGEPVLATFTVDAITNVTLYTNEEGGTCPGDTILTLFQITPDGRRQIARNDDFFGDLTDSPCSAIQLV
ncbi:MAG: DUF4215 domain-containing protein, partial [Myxococcales bacterium]|nr:DUF4215 domain-containing protein [Myxococcales bacterium]